MDLFSLPANPSHNLLPYDGTVNYYGKIFSLHEANQYYDLLKNNIQWVNDMALIYGKLIITKRKVAWLGDKAFAYTYSKTTRTAAPWTKELLALKSITEEKTGATYNSCLLNLYHTGEEGMAWHSDDEKDLKKYGAIASLSFGAERKFAFKHKSTGDKIDLILEHGSLLVMKDTTQSNWLHRLPPTTKTIRPRINLTFRSMVDQ